MKKVKKQAVSSKSKKTKYPSAKMIQSACLEDYKDSLDAYNKIYERVNFALAFCGAVLIFMLPTYDFTVISKMISTDSKIEFLLLIAYLIHSAVSIICIVWAVVKLLFLMRSRKITIFNSVVTETEKMYLLSQEKISLWFIKSYTSATDKMRKIIYDKQREYNAVIIKVVISILSYATAILINKGL